MRFPASRRCLAILPILVAFWTLPASAQTIVTSGNWSYSPTVGSFNGDTINTSLIGGPAYFQVNGATNEASSWQISGTLPNVYSQDSGSYYAGFANMGATVPNGGYQPAGTVVTIPQGASITLTNASIAQPGFFDLAQGVGAAVLVGTVGGNGYSNPPDPAHGGFDVINGGAGGSINNIAHNGSITVTSSASGGSNYGVNGIFAASIGGNGIYSSEGPYAGAGGAGANVQIQTAAGSTINMSNSGDALTTGLQALSQGGVPAAYSGVGYYVGASNPGGAVNVSHAGAITVDAASGIGIYASSIGGNGGSISATEGVSNTTWGISAPGGAVSVTLANTASINMPEGGAGIVAVSAAGATSADNPDTEYNAQGETVNVTLAAGSTINAGSAGGQYGIGVIAISAGTSSILKPFATQTVATSGSGLAGDATVNNGGTITTDGEMSIGIAALGVGGATIWTSADSSDVSYLGNSGNIFQAAGSNVTVTNSGSITTLGATAHGIVALSTGGGGLLRLVEDPVQGLIDGQIGWVAGGMIGANSNTGGGKTDADSVSITNTGTIITGDGNGGGVASIGIVAQSIGGSGGTAGGSHASFLVGDAGGPGGNGGGVDVDLDGNFTVLTRDKGSPGILAQSIGGGGGNGANAAGIFVATGGTGGSGGNGGNVLVKLASGSITTLAHYSPGIISHSIGGGGGHGGFADSAGLFIDDSIGGSGASGGYGGTITTGNAGSILTSGNQSSGMIVQSIGGGGGTGGAAQSFTAGVAFSASMATGGSGGFGGAGGAATGINQGSIVTGVSSNQPGPNLNGADSMGMVVQSIGGGGGHAGSATAQSFTFASDEIPLSATFNLAIGGAGGVAGQAGSIVAINSGLTGGSNASILTNADGSYGILAHSVGGGGGYGGDSTASGFLMQSDVPSLKIAAAIGGSGGSGGDGGVVTVNNGAGASFNGQSYLGTGSIVTHGQFAAGIVAQSIGGGGGAGGAGNASTDSPNVVPDDDDPDGGDDDDDSETVSVDFQIGVGGSGGASGGGQAVTVTNSAGSSIQTTGSGSQGILAQSIGGGGGVAGAGSSGDLGDTITASVAIGGTGGGGGSGGSVTVTNAGLISTSGGDSTAIIAQSIGGGGGSGGSSDADASNTVVTDTAYAFISPPSKSFVANLTVGGTGGAGGEGGSITVSNEAGATISTQGVRSFGILAQSVAGGGGNGGVSTSSSNTAFNKESPLGDPSTGTYSGSIAMGGNAGSAGNGGSIIVTNDGSIATAGFSSHAIIAQSIAGGGGTGGDGTVDNSSTIGLGAAIGGNGGSNGNGGGISIAQTGSIITSGVDASGVFAQSIGGGGGSVSTGTPYSAKAQSGVIPGINVTLGRTAGQPADGDGGSVSITQSGTVFTGGDWAHGVLAQSIGSGGGKTHSVFSLGILPDVSISLGAGVGIGNGWDVTVTHGGTTQTGAIVDPTAGEITNSTGGYAAFGIVAQSIGGGGGVATVSADSPLGGDGISVGTRGQGNGNEVNLYGDGSVITSGEAAHAIVLQSIGGGGGISGVGQTSATGSSPNFTVTAGGSQAIGNGGSVTIGYSNQPGQFQIQTSGDNAFGILAQSIGGGGGLAWVQDSSNTTSQAGNGSSSTNNRGGAISVNLAGSVISTSGNRSHALVAQSIGGGGGVVNYPDGSAFSATTEGSFNSQGNGGNVQLTVDAQITTTGDGAFGILAQSIGGGGGLFASNGSLLAGSTSSSTANSDSGTVSITQSGSINVTGENSVGIFAQSAGGANQSNSVDLIVDGAISGGSGAQGYGVWVDGGASTLSVGSAGSITALSGNAILYTGNDGLDVTNNGTIAGSLTLGNGTLTNNGVITVGSASAAKAMARGGQGRFGSIVIDGDFEQSSKGVILLNTDFQKGKGDFVHIKGDAKLDGFLLTSAAFVLPQVQIPVLRIDGKITGELEGNVAGASSALFEYGLTQSGKQFFLGVSAANFDAGLNLTRNQTSAANHLGAIWQAGGSQEFATFFSLLDRTALDQPGYYVAFLQQLSPSATFGFAARTAPNMQSFVDSVLSYPRFSGKGTQLVEGEYTWGRMDGQTARQTGADGFRLNTLTWQSGGQKEIAPGWFLGGAAAFQTSWMSSEYTSGSGQGGLGAVTLKYQTEPWLFETAAYGSFGFYQTKRQIQIPGFSGNAEGSPAIQSAGFAVKASRTFGAERFYFRPSVALNTIYVHSSAYDEDGAGILNLQVEDRGEVTFVASPAVELGTRFDLPNSMVLRAFLGGGVDFLTNDSWTQDARFQGAPAGAGSFTTSIPTDSVVGRVNAGMQLQATERVDLFLQYNGEFSKNVTVHGGAFGATWWF